MKHKKVQETITRQTREKLGFVKSKYAKGSNFLRKDAVKTDLPEVETPEVTKWLKTSYILNRAGNIYNVPILDMYLYNQQYGHRQ